MSEKKILVVDDEVDFVRILSAHLKSRGYSVVGASDAVGAIAAAQKERPDLIILDVAMPGGDGLTVLKRLGASDHTSLIPVIVLTGLAPTMRAEAIAAGAVEFYVKPVDIDILLACIRKQLGQTVEASQGR
ncbi:MAG: response regulator [Sedimentisphaerales bacterium]|nr:response regulator [Sedimentisphaerales bacterium]